MIARGTAPDILRLKKSRIPIIILIVAGSDILNGTMIIQAAITTKIMIEPDNPRNIKTKRSFLTIPGTAMGIKRDLRDRRNKSYSPSNRQKKS